MSELKEIVEEGLNLENLKYCYDSLMNNPNMGYFNLGKHFGYLEAGLLQFNYLETEIVDGVTSIKTKMVKSGKWWKKDKKEAYQDAIIRMCQKLFLDNGVQI